MKWEREKYANGKYQMQQIYFRLKRGRWEE